MPINFFSEARNFTVLAFWLNKKVEMTVCNPMF